MANSHTQAALNQFTANTDSDEVAFHEKEIWDELPDDASFDPAEYTAELNAIVDSVTA
jgi:hypothetical protein